MKSDHEKTREELLREVQTLRQELMAPEKNHTSREILQLAMQEGRLGTWIWNAQAGQVHYEQLWSEILGYPPADIRSDMTFWTSHVHPEDREKIVTLLHSLQEGSAESFHCTHRLISYSGQWITCVASGKTIQIDHEGKPLFISGVLINKDEDHGKKHRRDEAKQLYEKIDNSPFEAVFLSENGICRGQNRAARELFGYSESEALGQEWRHWIDHAHRPQAMEAYTRSSGEVHETVALRKDGTTFPCKTQTSSVSFEGKNLHVTILRKTPDDGTKPLTFSDEGGIFNSIHNTSFSGIVIHDMGTILDCNQELAEITGYAQEELRGMDALRLVAAKDRETVVHNIVSGLEKAYEVTGVRKDGREYPLQLEGRAVPYRKQQVRVVEFRDITRRKRAEKALNESEAKYQALFDKTKDPILVIDLESEIIVEGNKIAEIFFGISRSHLMGMSFDGLLPHGTVPFAVRQLLHAGPENQRDLPLITAGGETRSLSVSTSLISFNDRQMALSIFRDVTRENRARAELMAAKDEAEKASTAKTRFLANMSHEIRTPLNGIMGMLQLLESTRQTDEQREYSIIAIESCKRLTRLLSDILDISRIETGELTLRPAPLEIPEIINHIVFLFKAASRETGVKLQVQLDPAIPPILIGDSARLLQTLTNFVGNSFKFTTQGSITLETQLLPRVRAGLERVLFTVSDTGKGIRDETLKTLFTPFTQEDSSSTRRYEGAGLGLSICKQLIALMGGTLSIENNASGGTTIHFTVLFQQTEQAASTPTEHEQLQETDSRNLDILVAEDVRVNRLAICRLLEKQGHRVKAVENGQLALEALRTDDYDLLLMDVQMPVMDGLEATRAIRMGKAGETKKMIPIIALTAHAMDGDREIFLDAGMTDYLAKPVDASELMSSLSRRPKTSMHDSVD